MRTQTPGSIAGAGPGPDVTSFTDNDYEAIEAAVLETQRGRWFLGEFAKRNRAADTMTLLEAIRTLERGISGVAQPVAEAAMLGELESLSRAIAPLLEEVEATAGEPSPAANGRAAAERLQALAAGLRRGGADCPDPATIDAIIDQAALLGEAYDRVSQRAAAAIDLLAHIRARLDGLLAATMGDGPGAPGVETALAPENLAYFGGDEELFEAAMPPPGRVTQAAAAGPSEPTDNDAASGDRGIADLPGDAMPAAPAMEAPLTDIRPVAESKQRIVIVRRRSSDETIIPLADDADAGSAVRPASGA